jgi:hypothetical protein
MNYPYGEDDDIQEYASTRDAINIRNATLEEVAREIEKLHVFGKDTIDSFAVFIREMKHERFR